MDAPPANLRAYASPTRQIFDADAIGIELTVRTRQRGDRFHPLGMWGAKSLKDYFIDIGLPAPRRAFHPIVEAQGRVVWIVGHAVAQETAVQPGTRRWLHLEAVPWPKG